MHLSQLLRESLISFDDEAVAPSQAPSVDTVTSKMQALSKLLTLDASHHHTWCFHQELNTRKLIREIKSHVYGKQQTSDSSWEFLKIDN